MSSICSSSSPRRSAIRAASSPTRWVCRPVSSSWSSAAPARRASISNCDCSSSRVVRRASVTSSICAKSWPISWPSSRIAEMPHDRLDHVPSSTARARTSDSSSSWVRADELDERRHLGQHPGEDRREHEVDRAAGVRRRFLELVAAERGEEDDRRQLRAGLLLDLLGRLVAVEAGAAHVHDDHGEALVRDGEQRCGGRVRAHHPVVEWREHLPQGPAFGGRGVDHEDDPCLRSRIGRDY